MTKTNSIATRLHCSPMPIPVEFEDKTKHLAGKYVRDFSLSGLYAMDYNIVYNRVCNLIHSLLAENPEFTLDTFSHFLNVDTLFYSVTDIQTLVLSYKSNPSEVFPYVICFFARKLISFKLSKISYIRGLEREDVDEVMMIAVYKTLERYDPKKPFSFTYLDMELFAAVAQLNANTRTFSMPRNDFVNYQKFAYFIQKYVLTPENIPQFLYEINLPKAALSDTELTFRIDDKDREYSCKITLPKALDYFSLHAIENQGIICAISYDEDADMVVDNCGAIIDSGFLEVELRLYAEQTFGEEKKRRAFQHLTEPQGATFTKEELTEEYDLTRYELSKMKNQIRNDFL